MMHRFKAKKILIPDVPPPTIHNTNQGLVVASIGGLCAAVTMAAALLLFFGA
jgi:hypothetical protein